MIGDTMSLMQSAENLSIPQLQQSIHNGTLPAYIGIPILQRKLKQKQEALAPEVPPTATQPVASQVMSQARGLPVLPSNLSFADGGIVAFSEGGYSQRKPPELMEALSKSAMGIKTKEVMDTLTKYGMMGAYKTGQGVMDFGKNIVSGGEASPLFPQISEAEYAAQQAAKLQANPTQAPITTTQSQAATAQPVSQPTELTPEQVDQLDWTKMSKEDAEAEYQKALAVSKDSKASKADRLEAASTVDQLGGLLYGMGKDAKNAPSVSTADSSGYSTSPYAIAPPPASTAPSAFPTAAWESMQPTAEERDPAAQAAQMRAMLGEDPERAKLVEKIAKREEDLGLSERRAPWLALMQAGLATMGGKSPFAMANIGEGGIAGINAYMKSQDRLEDQRDKLLDMQGKLADKKRSEDIAVARYGMDSSQAAKAAARTTKQAELTQQQAYEANKAKMEFDYWTAQQRYGLESQQVSQQGRYYGAMAENARKDPETIRVFNEISQDPANKGKSVTELMGMAYNITKGLGDRADIADRKVLVDQLKALDKRDRRLIDS